MCLFTMSCVQEQHFHGLPHNWLTRCPEESKKHGVAVSFFLTAFWVSHQALCLGSHCRSSHCQAMSSPRFTPLWERRTLADANGFGCTYQAPLRNLSVHRHGANCKESHTSLSKIWHAKIQWFVIIFPIWLFGRIPHFQTKPFITSNISIYIYNIYI